MTLAEGIILAQPARWRWDVVFDMLPDLILVGLRRTIIATLGGISLALVLGLFLALFQRSRRRYLALPVRWISEFIRRTPLLVQIFFVFFVLPQFGITLTVFQAGLLALGVHYSTFTSEVYRAGINAISRGQWEAARALNFSMTRTWTSVILPQAIPPVIPALGNYLIAMFKDAPLLALIGYLDVLGLARAMASRSFRYTEAYTVVGVLFMLVSYPSALLVRKLEQKFGRPTA